MLSVTVPEPEIPLGAVGRKLWAAVLTEFGDWQEHELRMLNVACLALDEVERITGELADETDFKKVRQLRADRNASGNEFRKQLRELSLTARPSDSRPARISGRY